MTHTRGQLTADDDLLFAAKEDGVFILAECAAPVGNEQNRENARRIAACWNACLELPTEFLERAYITPEQLHGISGRQK